LSRDRKEKISSISYASAIYNLMYVMIYTNLI